MRKKNRNKKCVDCKWCSFFELIKTVEHANCLCPKSKEIKRARKVKETLGSEKEISYEDGFSCLFQREKSWLESLFLGPFCIESGRWFEPKEEIK